MDRYRYYCPEELYNSALRLSCNGVSLEILPRQYQKITNNVELFFACKLVSVYHVTLHDDNEMEVRCITDSSFMDSTSAIIKNYSNDNKIDPVHTVVDTYHDNGNEDSLAMESPESPQFVDTFENDENELSPWGDGTTKYVSAKRDRRNQNRNKSQNDIIPHAEVVQETQDNFVVYDEAEGIGI
jgi:hypothetical protein